MGIAELVSWGLAASGYALPLAPRSPATVAPPPSDQTNGCFIDTVQKFHLCPTSEPPESQTAISIFTFQQSRIPGLTQRPGEPPLSRADSFQARPIRCLPPRVDSQEVVTFNILRSRADNIRSACLQTYFSRDYWTTRLQNLCVTALVEYLR